MDTEPTKPLILVVDGSLQFAMILQFFFEQRGNFRAEIATSGASAIEKTLSLLPDLVFIYTIIPPPNGWECCKLLKQIPEVQHTPIVVCGALPNEEHQRQTMEVSALGCFVIPLWIEELIDRIQQIIASAQR